MTKKRIPEEAMLVAGKAGDKQFIQTPDRWPRWPFCPMKKRYEKEFYPFRVGLVVETDEPNWQSAVYLDANMYDLNNSPLKEAEKKVYASVDEMLADGWQVD